MTDEPAGGMVCLADGVVLQKAADEAVLLHLDKGLYFSLNAVGTRMLELARQLPDVPSVVAALELEYETTPDVLERDLRRLLAELAAEGLVDGLRDTAAGGGPARGAP
jgi:hypothetical protein